MDTLSNLGNGFAIAFDPTNLLFVFIGVVIGTAIGVLPGLGPTATIALLLPITYTMDPTASIIMLAGIYYGSMYGGTITSVLLRLPGEAASVVTTFDGYQMTKQGRAGTALGIAAIGSFIGGTVAIIGLTFMAPMLANIALSMGPSAFVALMIMGLFLVTSLGSGSAIKSICMAAVGLLLATVGQDPIDGSARFTFGQVPLLGGLDFVAVAMGLFGVAELIKTLEQTEKAQVIKTKIRNIWPSRKDMKESAGAIGRGSILGFFIGILPGGGGVISSLASYATEKKLAKDPSRFGKGAIEGVAGPETANNASSSSAFIPLLVLGIPSNVVLAMIFGALLMHGITPGPQLMTEHSGLFWGVIASMYVGNLMLLILNVPLVGVFIQMLRVRQGILVAFSLLIVLIGVYSINNSSFDMWVVLAFGVLGWIMSKTGFDPAPLVLAFVLGPILEKSFRQSMLISGGSLDIFVTDPASAIIFAAILVMIGFKVFGGRAKKRPASVLTSGGSGSTPATDPVDQRGENSGLETEKVSETTK
ncbi:tripartite tricarboxylate transporter permease [Paeniglutamicibacter sulfureus]|uniref:tripartite tricarboxylate transporter permease n=1 Tax=Paeniglutamicibacter sulfureus TaxID=43666 RepID=UPI002666655B|nr:tripartite tricarboxylate transporter permease [Paeniglutamicibacter sulfureus]MDO2934217.1 tripartite tricarboxylate transporter permease [Paeniglutamicibacter sulfureus]